MENHARHNCQFSLIVCIVIAMAASRITNAKSINNDVQPSVRDLQTASSSFSNQYYDWGGNSPGGYNFAVTGNGLIGDSSRFGGYDASLKENDFNVYPSVDYNTIGFGQDSDKSFTYNRDVGYHSLGGYGGYGGNGGNGGLSSYYGYNNPNYQGANHLGFGYYNKRLGYGNIYSSGVTPNLVTGYRGYSRR